MNNNFIKKYLSPFWLIFLAVLLLVFLILAYSGVLIEDLQTYFFPLFLVTLWRLPRSPAFRLPVPLVIFAFFLWVGVESVGAFSRSSSLPSIRLSRLQGDSDGLRARGLYQRYNEIARTYELPSMSLLQLSFDGDAEAREWLDEKPNCPFLIYGPPRWFRVVFPRDASRYFADYPRLMKIEDMPQLFKDSARHLGILLERDVAVAYMPGVGVPLALTFQPEVVGIPGEPAELSRHGIAWLAKGLERGPWAQREGDRMAEQERASRHAARFDAFYEAGHISGPWKTNILLGLSYYFMGTLDLLEALDSPRVEPVLTESALRAFRKAAALVVRWKDPGVAAAVFNNAAVAQLAKGTSSGDLAKARKWFKYALTSRGESQKPSLASRVAMLNLISLDQVQ